MKITRAEAKDACALTEIAFAAKRHWGYPEKWIDGWRQLLTIQPELIASHETYVAMLEGRAAGFYVLQPDGGGGLQLLHLWILPEFMRRGIGRSLFLHAAQRAGYLGYESLEIESDPNAAGFYERMGARRAGSIVSHIENQPRELPIFVYQIKDHSIASD